MGNIAWLFKVKRVSEYLNCNRQLDFDYLVRSYMAQICDLSLSLFPGFDLKPTFWSLLRTLSYLSQCLEAEMKMERYSVFTYL